MGIEIILTAGTFLVTAVLKIFMAKRESEQETLNRAIAAHSQEHTSRMDLANKGGGFAFTRRAIAVFVVIAVIGVPLIGPIFWPMLPVSHCAQLVDTTQGFWGLFSWEASTLVCREAVGVEILPFHTQLVGVIIGFYFGNKVGK